jgi:hypothetical protein
MSAYYKKLAALLAAGALAIGAVGAASAASVEPVEHDGNITIEGGGNNAQVACDADDAVLFGSEEGGTKTTATGVEITVTYNTDPADKGFDFEAEGGLVTIVYVKGSSSYNEYNYGSPGVASDTDLYAPDNASGQAAVSHLIFCTEVVEETDAPTGTPFQSVFEETDAPTGTPFQSVFEETDAPTETPFQSVEGDTDEPSEPDTATIGGSKDLGSPAESAWLLVVALGVLLSSIVVLTPARAKAPRR